MKKGDGDILVLRWNDAPSFILDLDDYTVTILVINL